ncbi:hypothetical protein ACVWZR_009455 [Bradyrhizobium sp. i1.3.1]
MYEWEGVAGQPAKRGEYITYDYLANFDVRQADYAIDYIKKHAKDAKPFFMDVNFMKMHNPTNASSKFAGKSRLGDYSDSVIELDDDIGRVMDAIRAEAPNTIVIVTADNGAWQDAYPDAGTTPFRGEKGSAFEGGWRVPGLMWWPEHIPAGANYHEMMSHIDCWATLAKMVGLSPPPHGAWTDDNGRPIYFDSIDNSEYILGRAKHSARRSWIYIDGESFMGARADVGGDPTNPDLSIAWKVSLDGQGHLARSGAKSRRDWLGLQSDDGPIREIRHGFQRRDVGTYAIAVAGQVHRTGQRLGLGTNLPRRDGVQQIELPTIQASSVSRAEPRTIGDRICSARKTRSRCST